MRQVLQQLGTGKTMLAEVPAPGAARGGLCITTRRSLISAGTERMLVDFGRASMINKARQQPEKVRQVLGKMATDGIMPTIDAVRSKLDTALPLGYCNVGVVNAVGADVTGFSVGDRVVSNGQHAEVVAVPRNLCAKIPDNVSDDNAAFTVLGAIGLQGVRLTAPTLGESIVVIGLGLIGLVTVQLLRANGCRVLGIDFDPAKTALARQFGAETVDLGKREDPLAAAEAFSRGRGVDGVIITAATQSNDPVTQAAQMSRKRGRIILVGVAGLQLNRADFYEKELSFQVSCSYGPGRYDPLYEQQGQDYPLGFVRWTEQRNFEAILDMMATGALDMAPLTTHRFALDDAGQAYDLLASGSEPYLGILIEYPDRPAEEAPARRVELKSLPAAGSPTEPSVAFIGSGNYASRVLAPGFAAAGARLQSVVSSGGVSAAELGRKLGFATASTDSAAAIADPAVNTVAIATRHDTHARFVQQALEAGKHVFVEKPLAITHAELDSVEAAAHAKPDRLLMVGFNRRFAPHIVKMKSLLSGVSGPKTFIVTVNAGAIPANHWTQDPAVGGGRIIGEGCHFIDLLRFLAGAPIEGWHVARIGGAGEGGVSDDKASITLSFADGSVGTIHYFANGNSGFPKERIEAFCAGRSLHLDNFRRLRGHGWSGFSKMDLWRQDKGQAACAAAFVNAIRGGTPSPIGFDELMEVSRVTVSIGEAARLDRQSQG
ncbi:MAG: bi-domain-containing oxidoreductase [Sphingomonadaceae bacterium]|nr:bi-domain-containing oxidoreductase [Sphingomonadaceae bacterium]